MKYLPLIVILLLSGCDVVDLDPTNSAMIEMRDDIKELNDKIDDGLDVRLVP